MREIGLASHISEITLAAPSVSAWGSAAVLRGPRLSSRNPRLVAGLVLLLASASTLIGADEPFVWRNVDIQGMGYVTGMVIHPRPPYDIYIRTDAGGAYRFDRTAAKWIPLMDRFGPKYVASYGVVSLALDPHAPRMVWAAQNYDHSYTGSDIDVYGEVMVSQDRGESWRPTGLGAAKIYMGPNDDFRGTTGERLVVDVGRSQRLYFGSQKDGLWIKDGAAAWRRTGGGLPPTVANPGITFVLVDPSAGATSSRLTRRLYAGVYGSGVWRSDDAGDSWKNILGPKTALRAALAPDGALFVTSGGDESGRGPKGERVFGGVDRYRAGVWNTITPQGVRDSWSAIACHPRNPQFVLAALNHSVLIYSSMDQGDTWALLPVANVGELGNQPPYYPKDGRAPGWGDASLLFDPAKQGRVWQTNGFGVISTEDIAAKPTVWTWWMKNLEELVVQSVKAPPLVWMPGSNEPGADLLSAVADMVGFRHARRDRPPEATMTTFKTVGQATSVTYCAKKPEYAAFVGWENGSDRPVKTGWTGDNGKTWRPFEDTSPGTAGQIAMSASDPMNLVWAPIRGRPTMVTMDGGKHWRPALLASGGPLPSSWQISGEWWSSQVLVPDRVEGRRFYFYADGDFYMSSDGGATWILQSTIKTTSPGGEPVGHTVKVSIVASPVRAGDLYLSFARNSNQPGSFQLLRSVDYGNTFSTVQGLNACYFVALGKGKSDAVPFVYAFGRATGDSADAIYKSEDGGASWHRISDPALHGFGNIGSLEADMRTRDLVYVGTGGRGIFYGRARSNASRPSTR